MPSEWPGVEPNILSHPISFLDRRSRWALSAKCRARNRERTSFSGDGGCRGGLGRGAPDHQTHKRTAPHRHFFPFWTFITISAPSTRSERPAVVAPGSPGNSASWAVFRNKPDICIRHSSRSHSVGLIHGCSYAASTVVGPSRAAISRVPDATSACVHLTGGSWSGRRNTRSGVRTEIFMAGCRLVRAIAFGNIVCTNNYIFLLQTVY